MPNPYTSKKETAFWKTAVANHQWDELYPVVENKAMIKQGTSIAAAGSCFAQKVADYIKENKSLCFLELENVEKGQPLYSARYGNIYTVKQLLQLFDEAFSNTTDPFCAIQREDGRYVDIHRPYIYINGFDSPSEVLRDREIHLKHVREAFTEPDIFIFTLGLTEAWRSTETMRVLPVCPGIYSSTDKFEFVNFDFNDVEMDLRTFMERLHSVNRNIEIILTVSPVPLTATYTDEHVLCATSNSKSILRAACSQAVNDYNYAHYFPSYEIVTNPFRTGTAFEDNKRSVKPDVVRLVMRTFEMEYMDKDIHIKNNTPPIITSSEKNTKHDIYSLPLDEPVCDDVQIEKSIGF